MSLLHTLSALLLCIGNAIGYDYIISTVDEYSTFVSSVNGGTSYSGTTVLLDSDLSFSGYSISPIGMGFRQRFCGTFDGRGHVISNLSISASLENVGMFGYSIGLTIMNVVLDDSCSVESTYSSQSFVGGIIGYCSAINSKCNIYNSVNMASVTFSGRSKGDLSLGGIAGYFHAFRSSSTSGYDAYIQNCANYGPVTHSGTSSYSDIGGIAGYSYGYYYYDSFYSRYYYYYAYLQNCLNYGTITHNRRTINALYLGGITGYTRYAYLKNCLSIGAISTSYSNYIGSILGLVYGDTYLYYCYFTEDVGISSYYGVYNFPSTSNTPNSSTAISTAVNNLNSYSSENGWNKWLLNTNSAPITFKYNDNTGFTTSSNAIILPVLLSYGSNSFMGWFGDTNYSGTFTPESISNTTTLYGLYGVVVTVAFDGNGESISQQHKYVLYNSAYGTLPTPDTVLKTGHSFGWFTEEDGGTEVTEDTIVASSSSHTLYARWVINNYTLTFAFNNGTDSEVRILNYNEEIVYPDNITREGYTFRKWDNNITNMPASDLIITAQWTANDYTVNFDPSGGDVTQKSKEVTFDSAYGELPTPNLTGYTFAGWFTEKNGKGKEIKEDTIVTVARNHALYACWVINNYTVTFILNNGADPEVRVLDYNEKVVYPENITKEGYTFSGWDKNITHMPANDLTITAQWAINQYALTFDYGNGTANESLIYYEQEIVYPESPAREGYTFSGWDRIVFRMPARNTTIKAIWIIIQYTLTFVFDNGAGSEARILDYNEKVAYPESITKEGYTFIGWDNNITNMPANDLIITAQWTINNYTLTFVFDNGTDPEVRILNFSQEVVYPENIAREGYTFSGWDKNITNMPANDLTITAQWTINQYALTFDYGNGTANESLIDYGQEIVYPENPAREGYTFSGWDSNITHMPANDLNITAQWTSLPNNRNLAIYLALGIAVPLCIIIIALIAFIIFLRLKRKQERENGYSIGEGRRAGLSESLISKRESLLSEEEEEKEK